MNTKRVAATWSSLRGDVVPLSGLVMGMPTTLRAVSPKPVRRPCGLWPARSWTRSGCWSTQLDLFVPAVREALASVPGATHRPDERGASG